MPEYRWRISPSGPFIEDGVSGQPLPGGDGSTGRIWRAQGNTPGAAGLAIAGLPAPGLLADLTTTWSIPVGFHYDVKAKFKINCSAPNTVGTFYLDIQAELNSVWTSIVNYTVAPVPFSVEQHDTTEGGNDETYCYSVENVDWDLTSAPFPATGMRVVLTEAPGTGMVVLEQQSNLRVEQYVIT